MKRACPRLRFTRQDLNVDGKILGVRIEARARAKGPLLGAITLRNALFGAITLRNGFRVSHLMVEPDQRRCGIATRLYERAAKIACSEFKTPLRSDIERSEAAQGFWEKQVAKGRARCLGPEPSPKSFKTDGPAIGRGGCEEYALTCPAPGSLARPPRRR